MLDDSGSKTKKESGKAAEKMGGEMETK